MKYVIQIEDQDGKTCRIMFDLPFAKRRAKPDNSTWQTLNEGLLKFHSGGCGTYGFGNSLIKTETGGILGDTYMLLFVGNKDIVQIDRFIDRLGLVNSSGEGGIKQEAVINFKPGRFSWTLIE